MNMKPIAKRAEAPTMKNYFYPRVAPFIFSAAALAVGLLMWTVVNVSMSTPRGFSEKHLVLISVCAGLILGIWTAYEMVMAQFDIARNTERQALAAEKLLAKFTGSDTEQ
ncbi:hypothetical protein VNF293_43540 (plasmid) [Atlantibacter hermannii]